jgi:hypothetical protein
METLCHSTGLKCEKNHSQLRNLRPRLMVLGFLVKQKQILRNKFKGFIILAYRGVVLATGAMLLRNSLILAILAVHAFTYSLLPMLIMLATTTILLRFATRPRQTTNVH